MADDTASAAVSSDTPAVRIVDEPQARIRRFTDLLALVGTALGVVLVLFLAEYALSTTQGIAQDIAGVSPLLQRLLVAPVNLFNGIVAVIIPATLVIDLIVRREPRRLIEVFAAAVGAFILTLLLAAGLVLWGTPELGLSLTPRGAESLQLPSFVAAISAMLTAAGRRNTRRTLSISWNLLWLGLAIGIIFSVVTIPSALLTVLLGRAAGLGLRYWLGSTADRAYGDALVEGVRRAGFHPRTMVRADMEHVHEHPELDAVTDALARTRQGRVYAMTTVEHHHLLVVALDGDQQAAGFLSKLWGSLRLRGVDTRADVSLRSSAESTALVSHAARVAGVRTGRVLGMSQIRDTMLLVYQRPPAVRPFADVPEDEVDDALLDAIWTEVDRAHGAGLSHRRLDADTVLVGDEVPGTLPTVWLTAWELGEVATSVLAKRIDAAQVLALTAAKVGPERAVDSAFRVLGAETVEQAAPLLQSIVLPATTRRSLRGNPHGKVLEAVRQEILERSPDAEVGSENIVRFGWRTVATIALALVAVAVIAVQFNTEDFLDAVQQANPWWLVVGFAWALLTFVGAALAMVAFSPVRLPFSRVLLTQVAAAYVALAVPAGVGPAALNLRLLTRRKVATPLAVATVALVQVSSVVVTVVGLVILTVVSGGNGALAALPSTSILIGLGVVAAAIGLALTVPRVRAWAAKRIMPTVRQTWPRLSQVLGQPWRLGLGLLGNLLLTVGFVGAFHASLMAFGQDMAIIDLAVLFFVGNAVGAAVPTPGGLGAVELALTTGLTGSGMPYALALSAVLIYRLLSYWLRIPLGYVAMKYLEGKGEL
ncbi:lysylphosphatidylglycerol synthase transmembrane domain-containing protein [Demequina sp. SYSU T00039]|uniref:Lysylphosphatidylglycerol synthase transmembrane domain-containing protein n=1 Tax=Demequina lignilytica TaxID=3051663 RepID=A0AAW7M7P1_9MICO|nr:MULTISPECIES: lysylphosphatidylglycerol synthase transmembrane domain-containing protein [unclassified Demequina]MDN4477864.1 lysylphosphatidylglycerol synthase transmembrane domain-containing protein [Demequina sp. SYSU T00039-1]MDN4487773.1 lysylphosphatidylglycerol synthase transmembrane domain-containing protein [Demequina sp. SYSU T00039]MDN4490844.1 lysylphosphatidylglycerol synthase transmembrane domain-containing protein [Demequina sp. SYSU T00068]